MKLRKINIVLLICMMCLSFMPINLYALEGDVTTDTTVVETAPAEDVVAEDVAESQMFSYFNEDVETADLRDYSFTKNIKSIKSNRGMTTAGHANLNANSTKLYDAFLPELGKMADGDVAKASITVDVSSMFPKQDYTKEELGVTSIVDGEALSEDAFASIYKLLNIELDKVTYSLISNKPYEMYWFDKTYTYTGPVGISNVVVDKDKSTINLSEAQLIFEFPVAKEYSATKTIKTVDLDMALLKATSTATKTKAQEVVSQVTQGNKTHYEILKAYMDWVCGAVDYNKSVSLTDDYGNPWQMIWAFDNDPSTNIVCEGYAKAFKYLCDLTPQLTNDGIEVYLMQGDLGGTGMGTPEPHMWNVVHMNNGKNYLVDCTNMDPQSVNTDWVSKNTLFMAGAPKESGQNSDGTTGDKYSFSDGSTTLTFTYGAAVMLMNTPAERDLASTNYDPSSSTTPSNPTTDPTNPETTDPTVTPPTDNLTTDPTVENPTTTEDPEVTDGQDENDNVLDNDKAKDSNFSKGATVKTGDETNLTLYIVLLIVALGAVIGVVVYNRKKNKKE